MVKRGHTAPRLCIGHGRILKEHLHIRRVYR